jgi:hypothetical protein
MTLAAEGLEITGFENLGGGIKLTVVPGLALAETLTRAGWEIMEFKNNGAGAMLTIVPPKQGAAGAE